jgi:hypothetical protein
MEFSRDGGTDGTLYITDSNGYLNVFNVEHDDNELWLNTYNGNADNFYNADNLFVFVRRNSFISLPKRESFV